MDELNGNVKIRCDFCGQEISAMDAVAGFESFICRRCAKLITADTERKEKIANEQKALTEGAEVIKTPKQIREEIEQWVVGQDEAKKKLCVAIYHHYLRGLKGLPKHGRSNLLLVGPTGSGKTYIIQTIAKIVGLPLYIGDATGITEAGYVGKDVDTLLAGLLRAAGGDPELAKNGIIYLDEVDKIAERGTTSGRDVSGAGVQDALLKMIEGKKELVKVSNDKSVEIDTGDILFIFGGAFSDMVKYIKSKKCNTIGLGQDAKVLTEDTYNDVVHSLDQRDFIKYGFKPEFIGRIPITVHLQELNEDNLVHILTDVKDNIVDLVTEIFRLDGIKLTIPKETLYKIANMSHVNGTGARGLRTIVERSLFDKFYDLPGSDVKELVFTEEMVK